MPAKKSVSDPCNNFINNITNKIRDNDKRKEELPNASQVF
jgi:hypothetical protein